MPIDPRSPAALPSTVSAGSTGNDVKTLQRALNITADGVDGPETQAALKAFQTSAGLTPDGIAGPKTWAALEPTVHQGSTGLAVKQIQSQLGLTADGIDGPNTTRGIENFQSSHGLTADGIVGNNTWQALRDAANGTATAAKPAAPTPTPQQQHSGSIFDTIGNAASSAAGAIGDAAGSVVSAVGSAASGTYNAIKSGIGSFFGGGGSHKSGPVLPPISEPTNKPVPPTTTAPKSSAPTTPPSVSAPAGAYSQAQINKIIAAVPPSQQAAAKTNVPLILNECAKDGVTDKGQVAYILATAEHESSFGTPLYKRSVPLVEDSNPGDPVAYFDNKYNGILDNQPGTNDGYNYRGRGFVQVTGRSNYTSVGAKIGQDLVGNPDLAARPDIAAETLVKGVQNGWYDGGTPLSHYVDNGNNNFVAARATVNGTDDANEIAARAQVYLSALQ